MQTCQQIMQICLTEVDHMVYFHKTKPLSDLRNGRVSQYVVWRRGLLDPKRFDLCQLGHPADGLGNVPPLVGIDHLTQTKYVNAP